MRTARLSVVGLLALTACSEGDRFLAYEVGASAQTIVFGVLAPDDRIDLSVIDLKDGLAPIRLERVDVDAQVAILEYDAPTTTLQLDPGVLDVVEDEPSRPLPTPDRFFLSSVDDATHLSESAWGASVLSEITVRGASVEACVTQGGCFVATESGCSIPCPEPSGVMPPEPPAPVTRPAPPALAPCPAAWTERADPVSHCVPPALVESCPPGEAQFVDAAGCVPVGATCGAGPWPTALPEGRPIVYVDPGFIGGDGTRSAPLATVTEALSTAPDGAVIALARGVHAGFVVTRDVAIVGACAADTVIEEPGDAIRVRSGSLELRDASVRADGIGLDVDAARAELEGVVFEISDAPTSRGVVARGATVTMSLVVLRGGGSHGGRIVQGASLVADRLLIEGPSLGIAFDASTGDLQRLRIRDAVEWPEFPTAALHIVDSQVVVSVAEFRDSRAHGTWLRGADASLALSDAAFEDVATSTNVRFDIGVTEGASVELTRTSLRSGAQPKITIDEASMVATDVVLVTEGEAGVLHPSAVVEVKNGALMLTRGAVVGGRDRGIDAFEGAEVRIDDLIVRHILDVADDRATVPLRSQGTGTTVVARRLDFEQDVGILVSALDEGHAEVSDLTVVGDADDSLLVVLSAVRESTARAHGVSAIGPWTFFTNESELTLEDIDVDVVTPGVRGATLALYASTVHVARIAIDTPSGPAVNVADAPVTIEDLLVTQADYGGVFFNRSDGAVVERYAYEEGEGPALFVEGSRDLRVFDFRAHLIRRVTRPCESQCMGSALVVQGDPLYPADVDVERVHFDTGEDWAIELGGQTDLSLHDGMVAKFETGVLVRVPPFDVRKLLDGVRFVDVVRLVESAVP